LEISSPRDGQVADLIAYSAEDVAEHFSPGRTLDYNERILITAGHALYSNRSSKMLTILRDDAGRHDYLLAPCSERMFQILHKRADHPSCHGNLSQALAPFGITPDQVDGTFNVFMNVAVADGGGVEVRAPASRAGDALLMRAEMDLIVGLTACSSEHTNAGLCKPIDYRILSEVGHGDVAS